MKLFLVVLLFTLVCISYTSGYYYRRTKPSFRRHGYRGSKPSNGRHGYRGSSSSKFRCTDRSPGSCPQILPRPMDLDRFRRDFEGDGYTGIMIALNFDVNPATDFLYHANMYFTETGTPGVFTKTSVGRALGETTGGDCALGGTNTFTAKRDDLAVFSQAMSYFGSDFQVTYFSNDPSYIFEVGCNETSGTDLEAQCCTGGYFIGMYGTNDPPHFLNWKQAIRDLCDEMGINLGADFLWLHRFLACDNARP